MPGQQCQRETKPKYCAPAMWLSYRRPASQREPGEPGDGLDDGQVSRTEVAEQTRRRHVTHCRHERGKTRQFERKARQEQHPQASKHQVSQDEYEVVVTK